MVYGVTSQIDLETLKFFTSDDDFYLVTLTKEHKCMYYSKKKSLRKILDINIVGKNIHQE